MNVNLLPTEAGRKLWLSDPTDDRDYDSFRQKAHVLQPWDEWRQSQQSNLAHTA